MEWLWNLIDIDMIQSLVGDVLQQQITQHTIAFVIAWKIVKRDMRKEMDAQFMGVTTSINAVALALEKVKEAVERDLRAHAGRLQGIEDGLVKLDSRVGALEKKP